MTRGDLLAYLNPLEALREEDQPRQGDVTRILERKDMQQLELELVPLKLDPVA